MRCLVRTGIAALLLLLVGCVEEKNTLTVHANGAGTIRLHQKISKSVTDMILSFEKGDAAKRAAGEKQMYKALGRWQGIEAWSNPSNSLEDGALVIEALGYFDHVSRLKMTEGKSGETFTWAKGKDGGFSLTWMSSKDSEKKDILGDYDTDEKVAMAKNMMGMFQGLRIEHEVVLPGEVIRCTGCTVHAGRSVSRVITETDITEMFKQILDYRQQVADGKLTKDGANARLRESQARVSADLQIKCRPAKDGRGFEQFQADFLKARAEDDAAGTADKVQAAMAKP